VNCLVVLSYVIAFVSAPSSAGVLLCLEATEPRLTGGRALVPPGRGRAAAGLRPGRSLASAGLRRSRGWRGADEAG
jgi:hypothetical protein